MNKLFCHPIFYIIFQLLGIGIDGMVGVGFEMMAVLILSVGRLWNTSQFLEQGIYLIIAELIIDIFGGDLETMIEAGLWVIDEIFPFFITSVIVFVISYLFIINYLAYSAFHMFPSLSFYSKFINTFKNKKATPPNGFSKIWSSIH